MEIYQTEEQQVDAIKKFWSENGNGIIAGIVLGLGGFVGFNLYKDSVLEQELATSDAYQTLIESAEKDPESFAAKGDQFIKDNAATSYASLTALALAKEMVDKKDWAQAEKYLQTAVDKAPSDGIKAIATLRLARIQVQQEKLAEALASLSAQLPESFTAAVQEIKGDVYLQQDKKDLARNAYQAAIDADGLASSPGLQMKLDDLAQVINLGTVALNDSAKDSDK
ncbi:tetratricopeptide repeat protein [Thalassomonas viridans]|uniref:Ancillary SecYEG translocon subunit n=1 Tax=Thalassomonas viridans TaxID=137584 RepID=A0AAE9Z3Q8_9GAMM|nr:tetratricopeptide repeat protein [Thalassomonas viridans]WDE06251.1 tetratricopeptide repeat protein [Thalassomonas viridans]